MTKPDYPQMALMVLVPIGLFMLWREEGWAIVSVMATALLVTLNAGFIIALVLLIKQRQKEEEK